MIFLLYLAIVVIIVIILYRYITNVIYATPVKIFSIENTPYLYQSEFYSLAWGRKHYGFYIDPVGITYKYKMPENWNFIKHDIIEAEQLFQNIELSVVQLQFTKFLRRKIVIPDAIIKDLMGSTIEDHGMVRNDAGDFSNSLLVYDSTIQKYRRILLNCDGDYKKINQSKYTDVLISGLGEVRRHF